MKIRFFKAIMAAASLLLLGSCNVDDDYTYYYPSNNIALGIIANASPDSDGLFFYADQNDINQNPLEYTNAAGYYNFYLGDRTFSIQDSDGHELTTLDKTLTAGDFFTLFAVNNLDAIELIAYDDLLEYPAVNHAGIRFINLSPDAPAINVATETDDLATALEFKQATEFMEIPAGTYNITYTDDNDTTLYTDVDMVFTAGKIYTIYTKGYVTPPAGSEDTFSTKRMRNY